ncbi:Uncharacterized protein conserved in bacteria [uncultured Bacteroides sp.]|uniref:acyltransferase family protein n=1 Tax=Bacteroides cellulolyticus TaxID=2981780 RepID=UPI000821E96D|nr:acyltransferase family protein [Bacteroides cellulolyticus]MCU6770368.1 acyltransferase family protein [Bacteroides cellulolyticus]SCH07531.1 Uncharacterized protein conserved in bacteria [uncultured Bacteroides sp.]
MSKIKIDLPESCAISILRSLAMVSIVTCHILQATNNKYCWLFNIGVQVFLAISGYLNGRKYIENWIYWAKKRLNKLYVPYITFILICFIFYYIFAPNNINVKSVVIHILDLQGLVSSANISGLSHLWFMSIIAICYIITPILQFVRKYNILIPVFIVISILNFFIFKICVVPFSWLFVYIMGYMYGASTIFWKRRITVFVSCLFIWLSLFISWEDILDYQNIINQLFHAMSGLFAIIFTIILFKRFNITLKNKIISTTDKYSYEIYLVHHVFILGPFSLMTITGNLFINISSIIVLTFLCSIILNYISSKICSYINNK